MPQSVRRPGWSAGVALVWRSILVAGLLQARLLTRFARQSDEAFRVSPSA